MYSDKFVLAIKCGGQVLREDKDTVHLPFGSEYSIYLKNLETRRAQVRVWIDGSEVTKDVNLVVSAGQAVDLERFIRNGNMKAGNRFKFIERIQAIEEHRGISAEDGLVRIEWQFEVPCVYEKNPWVFTNYSHNPILYRSHDRIPCSSVDYGDTSYRMISETSDHSSVIDCSTSLFNTSSVANRPTNQAGITAEGSISDQKFHEVSSFSVEPERHSMVIKLLGKSGEAQIAQPILVRTKTCCSQCGKKSKGRAKFCSGCGAGLETV